MAQHLCVFADSAGKKMAIRRQLGGAFNLEFIEREPFPAALESAHLLIDVDLRRASQLRELKEWLGRNPTRGCVLFVTDKRAHNQTIQAHALGATDVVHRPLEANSLIGRLANRVTDATDDDPIKRFPGVGAALETLHGLFSSALTGSLIDAAAIKTTGDVLVQHIEEHGLKSWIDTVRRHHNQTYQHCLLVTGVAIAFGQHLGFSQPDRNRLAIAGMLHDIGKARVPVDILEKPAPLTEHEMAVLRKHPELGLEALKASPELSQDMLDVVLHHHEYLDGSGYPHGLCGSEISDFVRVATICDVFGALLERRSYKPQIRGDVAYQMLLDMGTKLDQDLVRAFKFASALSLTEIAA
jgi:putative nucleotidyltransferase with HDIG domain